MTISNRYDFVLLFDVKDGNPNGDPDAGNLPRVDPETGNGLVTDVCLKRKVRNYVQLTKGLIPPFDIYVKEKAVLGRAHVEAFQKLGIALGEESRAAISEEDFAKLEDFGLPDGLRLVEDDGHFLIFESDMDKKIVKEWLKEAKPDKKIKHLIDAGMKNAKSRKPSGDEAKAGRQNMCENYYDIRTFGAVMSLKSAPNCGQVRGPVQLTFARSIEQVVPLEHSITRMAVTTEAEAEKQSGDNRTMGRKYTIPYGLYRAHGFISAPLSKDTGFSEDDLKLFWDSLCNMFEHDRSAARGAMATQKLLAFKHSTELGNAHAHKLFDLISVSRKSGVTTPRSFGDYTVTVNRDGLPQGVELIEMC